MYKRDLSDIFPAAETQCLGHSFFTSGIPEISLQNCKSHRLKCATFLYACRMQLVIFHHSNKQLHSTNFSYCFSHLSWVGYQCIPVLCKTQLFSTRILLYICWKRHRCNVEPWNRLTNQTTWLKYKTIGYEENLLKWEVQVG